MCVSWDWSQFLSISKRLSFYNFNKSTHKNLHHVAEFYEASVVDTDNHWSGRFCECDLCQFTSTILPTRGNCVHYRHIFHLFKQKIEWICHVRKLEVLSYVLSVSVIRQSRDWIFLGPRFYPRLLWHIITISQYSSLRTHTSVVRNEKLFVRNKVIALNFSCQYKDDDSAVRFCF